MSGSKKAVLISEVGWRGMKELSNSLAQKGLSVDIIIKGGVDKEVLQIITKPAGLKIHAVPRRLFRPYLFFYILWHKAARSIDMIVATKEQMRKWIKGFGFEVKLLVEANGKYYLK